MIQVSQSIILCQLKIPLDIQWGHVRNFRKYVKVTKVIKFNIKNYLRHLFTYLWHKLLQGGRYRWGVEYSSLCTGSPPNPDVAKMEETAKARGRSGTVHGQEALAISYYIELLELIYKVFKLFLVIYIIHWLYINHKWFLNLIWISSYFL